MASASRSGSSSGSSSRRPCPHLGYFRLQNCPADLDSITFLCVGHIIAIAVVSLWGLQVDLLHVHDLLLLQDVKDLVDIKARLVESKIAKP
jgi:hypothetical protein